MDEHSSLSTIAGEEPDKSSKASVQLDLSDLPPIFVLAAHMDLDELHNVEEALSNLGGILTYDPTEARIFLGKVSQKRRAALELRQLGVWTKPKEIARPGNRDDAGDESGPRKKRRRQNRDSDMRTSNSHGAGSSTDSDAISSPIRKKHNQAEMDDASQSFDGLNLESSLGISHNEYVVQVVNLPWFHDTIKTARILSIRPYLVYEAERTEKPASPKPEHGNENSSTTRQVRDRPSPTADSMDRIPVARPDILKRAEAEAEPEERGPRALRGRGRFSTRGSNSRRTHKLHHASLLRRSTSDASSDLAIPEPPDWVKRGSVFSCERSTPANPPNDAFVEKLKTIRHARELNGDEIGVRAYSTAIAAVAAYPYTITSAREMLQLPGCEAKIAALWSEWKQTDGYIEEAHKAETDERLQILGQFYEIWGVGSNTARDFLAKGWHDLDDIVEFGWNELSRVQQIGLKFYDEFQVKIPRAEVEDIERKVFEHAQKVREPTGIRTCIVGGYRRGKAESGDADIILTHLDESQTLNIVADVVKSLVEGGWITHELRTSLKGTRRNQATLPFRTEGGGHGFDTLDKSMVVWQDPTWPGKDSAPEGTKNPNIHRRVDIIVAPWSKIGCAVLGWSGGTTFQRDIRRYARKVKGWKFDSSGVRDRTTGEEIDLQSGDGPCVSCEEAEKRVFAGFGLIYREPSERWTG